jgi:hypothetical protein
MAEGKRQKEDSPACVQGQGTDFSLSEVSGPLVSSLLCHLAFTLRGPPPPQVSFPFWMEFSEDRHCLYANCGSIWKEWPVESWLCVVGSCSGGFILLQV